jgi:hypothetical protein
VECVARLVVALACLPALGERDDAGAREETKPLGHVLP